MRRVGLGIAIGAFAVVGCGGGSEPAKPAKELAIDIEEFGQQVQVGVPKTVEAGVTELIFTNDGRKEHSAQLLRLDAGRTPQDALKAGAAWGERGAKLPSWLHLAGGFSTVEPGQTKRAHTRLEPGSYIVADIEAQEGQPAYGKFEVTGKPKEEPLPSAKSTISAREYSFAAPDLRAGRGLVLFRNEGKQPHHLSAAPLRPGATIGDVRDFIAEEKGRPPIDESKGFSTAILDGGTSQVLELNLEPGTYAMLCFVPDREGGPPHVARGMISEVTVR